MRQVALQITGIPGCAYKTHPHAKGTSGELEWDKLLTDSDPPGQSAAI